MSTKSLRLVTVPDGRKMPQKPGDRVSAILVTDLSENEKMVAVVIAVHLNRQGVTWLNVDTIADQASISRATVFRALTDGESAGWLHRIHRNRSASYLRIDWGIIESRVRPLRHNAGNRQVSP